jgi:asparagine synthase (glutamine-hydrolysing)
LCGIVGFTHRNRRVDGDRIVAATHSLIHRGPDQQNTYESEHVSLGATRLRIIDLCSSDQPMVSDDGNTVVLLNGEIYNYRELRAELEAAGHRFNTLGDTEVVLRAFLQWDCACLGRLRGMFAVAIWTESDRRLLLARDRLGIKPLYIHRFRDDLHFGSELKAILVHCDVERSLDLDALEYYLSLNYVPGHRTLIEGIEKLAPGHLLEWRDGRVRTEAYWEPQFRERAHSSMQSAAEELDFLLTQAVREHLISDVPLGLWLSGGIDSSTILHYASENSSSRLKTFSISFPGRAFDEAVYARQIAEQYQTEHHEFELGPELDLAQAIEEMAYYSDEPGADAGALPVWFLSRLSRRQVTVALSGEGSDELFGGYLTYQADRVARPARMVPKPIRRGLLRLLNHWPVSDDKISLEYMLKRFLGGSLLSSDEAHTYWNGTFSASEQRRLLIHRNGTSVNQFFEDLPAGMLNRYLAFDQRYYLPDDILYKVDRMSMAHSLEVRPPFLDHRIVEFAGSLPPRFKIRGTRQKVLLKHLMKDKLPASVIRKPKVGLDIPTHDWLRGPLRSLLLDTISDEMLEQTGLFRKDQVHLLIRDHLERRANVGYHLWGLMTLLLWMKLWKIQTGPAQQTARHETQFALTAV